MKFYKATKAEQHDNILRKAGEVFSSSIEYGKKGLPSWLEEVDAPKPAKKAAKKKDKE